MWWPREIVCLGSEEWTLGSSDLQLTPPPSPGEPGPVTQGRCLSFPSYERRCFCPPHSVALRSKCLSECPAGTGLAQGRPGQCCAGYSRYRLTCSCHSSPGLIVGPGKISEGIMTTEATGFVSQGDGEMEGLSGVVWGGAGQGDPWDPG